MDEQELPQKIVFVYIDKFGPLRNANVNLDSAIRCRFEDGVLRVTKGQPLPTGFWDVGLRRESENRHSSTTSVSLIVGANGTGKTTIARYLAELCACPDELRRFLVVYQLGNRYYCSYRGYSVRIEGKLSVEKHRVRRGMYERPLKRDFRLLYVSPHYTTHSTYEGVNDEYAVDLSTSGMVTAAMMQGVLPVIRFEREDQRRMFNLLAAVQRNCSKDEIERMHIPEPLGLLMSVSRFGLEDARDYVSEAADRKKQDGELRAYHDKQQHVAERVTRARNWFVKAFLSYALCYWHEYDNCGDYHDPEVGSYGFLLANFTEGLLRRRRGLGAECERKILKFLRENGPRYDQYGERCPLKESAEESPHYLFFASLHELLPNFKYDLYGYDVYLPFRSAVLRKKVVDLVVAYREVLEVKDFLDFCYHPGLSAGQEALFAMWARIYDWYMNPKRLTSPEEFRENDETLIDPEETSMAEFYASQEPYADMDNIVLFFDEAETSLHPEWQRQLVYNALWFVERFLFGQHVQIIFASHSPMLLTDIPKGNVQFLFSKGREDAQSKSLAELKNTFAANLYDLYQMSYFLENGPIGEFAKRKIEGLIRQPDNRVRNLVGDELLKRMLPKEGE